MKDMKEIFLQRLQVGGVWLRASTVFLSFNDLDRMLAKKCTKGSNLLRYLKKKALVSVLFQSRRFGIFLYQLLERLFYVSCVRVGPESCIFTARLWKRSAIFRDKGRFENLIFETFDYDIITFQVTSVRLFLGWKLSMSDFVGKLWNWISIMDATNPRRPLAASSQFRFMDEDRLV